MGTSRSRVSQTEKTCVLILGAQDSGNAVMAQMLGSLGCQLANSEDVEQFNDRLLASASSSADDFTPFYENWMQSPRASEFTDKAVELLTEQFGDAGLFVLSDTRITRLLPFWLSALKKFGSEAKAIFVNRSPVELGLSSPGENEALLQMIWLRQMLDAEAMTRGIQRFFTSRDRLLEAWNEVTQAAQEHLQIVWPGSIANAEFEVAAILDQERNGEVASAPPASVALPDWLAKAHQIFESWTVAEPGPTDLANLDRIRAEFDVASAAFARVIRANRVLQVDKRSTAAAVGKLKKPAAESDLQAQLQEARRNITLLTADVEREIEAREAVEFQMLEAQAEVASSRARRKEMARVISNREAKIDQLNQELEARYQELAKLQRHLMRLNPIWLTKVAFRRVARVGRA
jgi:hypothetical protein